LLWIGSIISFIGGNLTFIAFPWLVLKISGDPLAIGYVLAVSGIPRAAFMLIDGAATDRFSPRTIMLLSTLLRMLLMAVMATLTLLEMITMPQVLVLAFLFGTLEAFFWPASSAILPRLLDKDLLPPGNALLQGTGQASFMLGPMLAGLIISMSGSDQELRGIATVFPSLLYT
jgi:MFS family permease